MQASARVDSSLVSTQQSGIQHSQVLEHHEYWARAAVSRYLDISTSRDIYTDFGAALSVILILRCREATYIRHIEISTPVVIKKARAATSACYILLFPPVLCCLCLPLHLTLIPRHLGSPPRCADDMFLPSPSSSTAWQQSSAISVSL